MEEARTRALTQNELAGALGVSGPTVNRALASGLLVPTFRTRSGRARFHPEYVAELQRHAAEARANGEKHVMRVITAPRPGEHVMHDQSEALTANDLADALGVCRATIDRAIASGTIVPTFRTARGRVQFDPEDVANLQRRAAEARARGAKYVMRAITAPAKPPRPQPQMSASRFAKLMAWKRTVLTRKPAR